MKAGVVYEKNSFGQGLAVHQVVITINRQQEAMHHRTIAVQRKALLEQVAQRKAIHMTHMMMAMMISIWMAIMIMIGMTGIVIMPMVWMTQWMSTEKTGKDDKVLRKGDHYGRTLFYNSRLQSLFG